VVRTMRCKRSTQRTNRVGDGDLHLLRRDSLARRLPLLSRQQLLDAAVRQLHALHHQLNIGGRAALAGPMHAGAA
jgi:hypothetical protein